MFTAPDTPTSPGAQEFLVLQGSIWEKPSVDVLGDSMAPDTIQNPPAVLASIVATPGRFLHYTRYAVGVAPGNIIQLGGRAVYEADDEQKETKRLHGRLLLAAHPEH